MNKRRISLGLAMGLISFAYPAPRSLTLRSSLLTVRAAELHGRPAHAG